MEGLDPETRFAKEAVPEGRPSLRLAPALQNAIRECRPTVLEELIARGVSTNAPVRHEDIEGYITALGLLALQPFNDKTITLIDILLKSNANIDGRGSTGDTPLILACRLKNVTVAEHLLKSGANVNTRGMNNITALGNAAALTSVCSTIPFANHHGARLMRMLFEYKADFNETANICALEEAARTNNLLGVEVCIEYGVPLPSLNISLTSVLTVWQATPIYNVIEHERETRRLAEEEKERQRIISADASLLSYFQQRFEKLSDGDAAAGAPRASKEAILDVPQSPRSSEDSVDREHRISQARENRNFKRMYKRFLRKARGPCGRLNRDIRFQVCMFFILLVALFLPDIWVIGEGSAEALDVILAIVIIAFIVEFTVQMIGLRMYSGTFFCYMDILGCVSVFLDFSFFQDAIMPESGGGKSEQRLVIAQTARLAKLGARAGRFSKLVKLLRFLPGMRSTDTRGVSTAKNISSQLNHAVSQRAAILIILLVLIIPAFAMVTTSFPEQDLSLDAWGQTLFWAADGESFAALLSEFKEFYLKLDPKFFPFEYVLKRKENDVWTETRQFLTEKNWAPPNRRQDIVSRSTSNDSAELVINYNFAVATKLDSAMNIALISFIMIMLLMFSLVLMNVVGHMVLRPLESLLYQVHTMASTIYSSVTDMSTTLKDDDDEENGLQTQTFEDDLDPSTMLGAETVILEKVVLKMAVLSEITMKKATIDAETMAALNPEAAVAVESSESESDEEGMLETEAAVEAENAEISKANVKLEMINSWLFQPHDLDRHQQNLVARWFFYGDMDMCYWLKNVAEIEVPEMQSFIEAIAQAYVETNPYHSWTHGVDVTHCVFTLMRLWRAETYLKIQERFALLVGSMSHDVGHPGYNNPFLVETSHKLALRYNDKSPLENMHCAVLFDFAVKREGTAILNNLPKSLYSEVRKVCVEAIFHTDMVHHFAMVKDIQMLYEVNSEPIKAGWDADNWTDDVWDIPQSTINTFSQADNRLLIRNLFLHVADISNSLKPFVICSKWASVVLDEFFLQGDKEKELGIPVQMLNDRDKVNRPFSQIGFIEFIVSPLLFAATRVFPPLAPMTETMAANVRQWHREWVEISDPTDEANLAVQERISKIEAGVTECTFRG